MRHVLAGLHLIIEADNGLRHVVLSTEGDWLRPLAAVLRRGRRGA